MQAEENVYLSDEVSWLTSRVLVGAETMSA